MNNNYDQNVNNSGSYKSIDNLNTAIDSPSIDVDSVTSVNINNNYTSNSSISTMDNYSLNSSSVDSNSFDANYSSSITTGVQNEQNPEISKDNRIVSNSNGNNNYSTLLEKKEGNIPSSSFVSFKDLKFVILAVFLLLLFILFLPTLFDLFNKLVILITT